MAKRIGTLLMEAGVITEDHLRSALERQKRFGGRLVTTCLAQGYADERTLALVLSRQLGVPFVVLSRSVFPLKLLDDFPLHIARKMCALPVHRAERELFVTMAEPTNIALLDELCFTSGASVIEHGALAGVLQDVIEECYRLKEAGRTKFYEGEEVDPGVDLTEAGHLEIVVGGEMTTTDSLPPPAPAFDSLMQPSTDWVAELADPPPADRAAADVPRQKPIVLVVEDESELRRMLTLYLQKSGYDVWEASDGTEAIRTLQANLPDAIVLDAMLPGIHGFDICYRVKHSEVTRHIPVVMVSAVYRGWRFADDVRRLYGADHFLEKPLRLDELKHLLDQSLLASQSITAAPADELGAKAKAELQTAAEAYRKGDLIDSARHLEAAVVASPFCAMLHQRLGMLFEKLDEPYRAIAEMARAVELQPSYDTLLTMAQLYEKTGFTHKAFETWERCLRICPSEEDAERIHKRMDKLLA